MNTKKYALIVLVIIASGLIYYFTQSKSTLDKEFDIALKSGVEIDKFDLVSVHGVIDLYKVDKGWKINNQSIASQKRIESFLNMLSTLSVSSPITGAKGQEVIKNIAKQGVLVNCFIKGKQVYQMFFIYNPEGLKGCYAYKPGNKYLVQLSEGVNLDKLISVESSVWQSKKIFAVSSDNIKELVVNWGDENRTFFLKSNADKNFSFYRGKTDQTALADVDKLKYYSYEFANLVMGEKDQKYQEFAGELVCQVMIRDHNKQVSKALFYQLVHGEEVDKNDLVVNIESSSVWGKVSYIKMSPVLKDADFFLSK